MAKAIMEFKGVILFYLLLTLFFFGVSYHNKVNEMQEGKPIIAMTDR